MRKPTIACVLSGVLMTSISISASVSFAAKPKDEAKVVNDSWYTMQAGSAPWGYFHEIIELRDGRYSYRYNMTKYERGGVFQENIGALAQPDLTPIAFNLNKSGTGSTESTNATFSRGSPNDSMNIEVSGAKSARFKRAIAKNTILDVFFPVYLSKNWNKLKPGYRGWVATFAEDPEQVDFRSRTIKYEVKGKNDQDHCLEVNVEMENLKTKWCLTSEGALVDLVMKGYHVHRVSGEEEAKKFLSGVLPKDKQSK